MQLGLFPLSLTRGRKAGGGGGGVVAGMRLGMNLGGVTSDSGAVPFANVVRNMGPWERVSGAGSWSQDQGNLTASVGTDVFTARISDAGVGMPSGTYTVKNPNGRQVGFGTQGTKTYTSGNAAHNSTFTYTAGTQLFMTCTGSCDGVELLLPGHDGSDIFNSAFLAYHSGAGTRIVRTMDWIDTNGNIDIDWADRTVTTKMSFFGPGCRADDSVSGKNQVPWETCIALANRLNADLWVNVPTRSSLAYVQSLAALVAANLNSNLSVYVEYSNEPWNTSGLFASAYGWIAYLNHTRLSATITNAATGEITKTAHGYSNNQPLICWSTRANRAALADDDQYFRAAWGKIQYVEVIDANRFYLWSLTGPTGEKQTFPSTATTLTYIVENEATKVADLDAHVGEQSLRNWNAFTTAFGGATRVKRVLPSQASNSGLTGPRLAPTGVAAACDYVAIAPYFYGYVVGGAVDIASTQFTPKAWSNASGINMDTGTTTVHFSVYAAGSTPTTAEIIAGTGAINHQSFSANASGASYTSGVAVTGLTNGTSYKCYFVFVTADGYSYVVNNTISPSATTSTVDFLDTYANQATRCSVDLLGTRLAYIDGHQAAIAASANTNIKVICYEGGLHLDETMPTAISNWMYSWVEDSTFADLYGRYLRHLASDDVQAFCVFADLSPTSLSWTLADSYSDTSDLRYTKVSAYSGNVTSASSLGLSNTSGTNITSDPASFPVSVYTFSPVGFTYTIIKGNNSGNFDISGGDLRMINDAGVNWASNTENVITIHATNGTLEAIFTVTFTTGPATYYDSDDKFAWNSVADSNVTQINPDKGSALAISAGAGASITSGIWDNGGTTSYENATGLTSTINTSTGDFLIIMVLNKGALGSNFTQCGPRVGITPFIYPYMTAGTTLRFYHHNGTTDGDITIGTFDATSRVYWLHYKRSDGKLRYGINQTYTNPSGSAGDTPAITFPASFSQYVDVTANARKYGSIRVLNKDLTNAEVLAAVQKVQNLHGI